MSLFTQIKENKWIFRALLPSIYFNLHYLPFRQAIKLPILVYKPKFKALKGTVEVRGPLHFGMIKLGKPTVSVYPNSGIMWENHGGKVVFEDRVLIGNASALSIGRKGTLSIGENFIATTSLRVVCYNSITIGKRCSIAWESIVMDTDLHKLKNLKTGKFTKGIGSIEIGDNCWIGLQCVVLKGTKTPSYTIFGARSLLNKEYDAPKYSILAGNPVELKNTGFYRDVDNDKLDY
ncbi:MAG: hypothetical protein LUD17_03465 [Bacteroidales bacterium]|nr:hypothetical protein [Bacteroidales bacterium]